MRVIGGKAKGRKLKVPKGSLVRPTSDRVKEAMFNVLAAKLLHSKVLDLFAGVGSLGIEALSRGAEKAVFVEKNPFVAKFLKFNLKEVGFEDKALVLVEDVEKALNRMLRKKENFSLIFLDPPYKISWERLERILDRTFLLLDEDGLVVLEHPAKKKIEKDNIFKQKVYGDTALSFFRILR